MIQRYCDRCRRPMTAITEVTKFRLQTGDGDDARYWTVEVHAPRSLDLCVRCRQQIVAKGAPVTGSAPPSV